MALVSDQKFSTFQAGGDVIPTDIIVGLRGGINTQFIYTGILPPGVIVPISNGGTGATTAAAAATNLGLGVGDSPEFANVQIGGTGIYGANGLLVLTTFSQANSVNNIEITNGATGIPPGILSIGSDTDVGMGFVTQGAGKFQWSTTANTALVFFTGTAYQHTTSFSFPNTSASRTITWPDTSGTVALTSDINPWVDESTASVTMTANTGYTSDDTSNLVTFTLPTTSAIGDWVEINGKGSGLWTIAQASGQQIFVSSTATTSGVGGSLSSVNQYDNVRLRCITANTIWTVVSQQSTGLTIV